MRFHIKNNGDDRALNVENLIGAEFKNIYINKSS